MAYPFVLVLIKLVPRQGRVDMLARDRRSGAQRHSRKQHDVTVIGALLAVGSSVRRQVAPIQATVGAPPGRVRLQFVDPVHDLNLGCGPAQLRRQVVTDRLRVGTWDHPPFEARLPMAV